MFIAHLPAGYLLYRATQKRLAMVPLLIGSIAPDFDIALVLIGWLQTNHHHFIAHRPAFWLCFLMAGLLLRRKGLQALGIGAILHLMLDSIAGQINWAWPFGNFTLGLVDVIAQPGWWVWSFVRHWVFGLELILCTLAVWVHVRSSKTENPRP